MKRLTIIALILLLAGVLTAAGFWQRYQQFMQTAMQIPAGGSVFVVQQGANAGTVVKQLEASGITRMDWRWRVLNRLEPVTIRTGEYALQPDMTPSQLLALLASGKVITYKFTIVEGWTVRQLIQALDNEQVLVHSLIGAAGLTALPGLRGDNPEGWFLPETYLFVRGDTDLQILQRAYSAMQEVLDHTWNRRDGGLPFETRQELLTMASIIEKETSMESERAAIAGVFVRRLQQHWRLETDPTVIYGMGDSYDGNIRRKDLKQDTVYNTYTRRGLPPTPIALPGKASLIAAAHPADGEAMFFVADGSGGHKFSSTLDEHNQAVRQLLKAATPDPD